MGHIDRNLAGGETVVFRTNLHWVIFLGPLVLWVLGALLAGVSLAYLPSVRSVAELANLEQLPHDRQPLLYPLALGAFLLFASTWVLAGRLVRRLTTEFAVTDQRFAQKSGLIRRTLYETALSRLEGLGVHQNLVGRILGYGTIQVTGTGGSPQDFRRVAAPMKVRETVYEQSGEGGVEKGSGRGRAGEEDSPAEDRLSRLERLARLKEKGALTEEEFRAHKADLLGDK